MRRYVRHPSSIPIELSALRERGDSGRCAGAPRAAAQMQNVSAGGFACSVPEALPVGITVQLRIPQIWPDYRGRGTVVWCRPQGPTYEVGISFSAEESFQSKMAEQLCQIEQYRRQLTAAGRELDADQAAQEWIALHARDFSEAFFQHGADER